MSIAQQIDRLVTLGVPALAGVTPAGFRERAAALAERPDAVVVVHPRFLPARALVPLLRRSGKPGFVVSDMVDLSAFVDVPGLAVPDADLYSAIDVDRGDDLRNWRPEDVYPELERRMRSPLTVHEGISLLLTRPELLSPNACFMTIGSRKPKRGPGVWDSRTPAVWISGGTGRDGTENRGAPKLGWCWAGNRHTWLGFASTAGRVA